MADSQKNPNFLDENSVRYSPTNPLNSFGSEGIEDYTINEGPRLLIMEPSVRDRFLDDSVQSVLTRLMNLVGRELFQVITPQVDVNNAYHLYYILPKSVIALSQIPDNVEGDGVGIKIRRQLNELLSDNEIKRILNNHIGINLQSNRIIPFIVLS